MSLIEQSVKDIKKIYSIISGKSDNDVIITYKGTGYGNQFPWHARIDAREINAKTYDAAIETLRDELLVELQKKAESTAREADTLHKTLNTLYRGMGQPSL